MAKFAKSESLVEAIQYDGNNKEDVARFINDTEKYTAIMDFNETWIGYLLNRFNTIKRVEKAGQWLVLEDGRMTVQEDEEFAPRYTEVVVVEAPVPTPPLASNDWGPPPMPPVNPWAPVGHKIENPDDFPKHDHEKVWIDTGDDVWFWSDDAARRSGDSRCGWTWLDLADYEAKKPAIVGRTSYSEPIASWFPLKEYDK